MKIFLNLIFIIFTVFSFVSGQETIYSRLNQLDINNAELQEIEQLPVSQEIAEKLYERVLYKGYFTSIYQLKEIEGIDQELLNVLKPLIRIEPFEPKSSTEERIEELYYQLDRWSGNEGINDALIDLWIEKALDPMNVNTVEYGELINLQNVSPVDAVAIINYRNEIGQISNSRELRSIPGLSYYGYRNASRFLDYQEYVSEGLHGHITSRIDNTPFFNEEETAATEAAINTPLLKVDNTIPAMYYKFRFSYGDHYKFGFSYTRNLYEPDEFLNEDYLRIPKGKFYLGIEDINLSDVKIKKLYLGNYSLSIGQGVIMENTDFFTPRKSGYGFRKRFNGISGDNSRTREFQLRGIATELQYKNFDAILFSSFTSRDAILNTQIKDSTRGRGFNQFIVLNQRFEYALDDIERRPENFDLPWLNSVNEFTVGSNFRYTFFPGTYLGVTYYESAYDRPLEPDLEEIVGSENLSRLVLADNEIRNAYGGDISRGTNPFWEDAVSFRRVYGFDFQTVYKNIALQGEYGELDKGGKIYKLGDDPRAFVLSLYTQFNSLNILALYRNYDLGYDNPFQRSFSNYRRFKGTIYEDYYYLQSGLYGQLYENAPQPQAEEGYYLNIYYQISRSLISRIEYDNWVRKSDMAPQYRLVGIVDYRPVFPLSIQLRQKWQARNEQNDVTLTYFKNLEFRGRARLRLSGYDSFELFYVNSNTLVHPRPRVFGDIALGGDAIGSAFTHNFNQYLKFRGMVAYYKGFFWNFEDTQFVVMDSQRGAFRSWWSVYARLNNKLSLRFKLTFEHQKAVNNISYNDVRDPVSGKAYATDFNRGNNNFYYLEFNYNF